MDYSFFVCYCARSRAPKGPKPSSPKPQAPRPKTLIDAFTDGLRRVQRAPWLVIGLWLSTLVVALPAALVLHG